MVARQNGFSCAQEVIGTRKPGEGAAEAEGRDGFILLKIEYLCVEDLTPYERNARKHEADDIDAIAASIRKYGMNDPIGVWGKENLIVEGHGRLLACKQLGLTEVPVIRLDHLTDEERREYAIVHNRSAELSAWDTDMLAIEMEDLSFDGIEIDMDDVMADYSDEISSGEDDRNTERLQQAVNKEYAVEDFSDDKFNCKCPRCGFLFNA